MFDGIYILYRLKDRTRLAVTLSYHREIIYCFLPSQETRTTQHIVVRKADGNASLAAFAARELGVSEAEVNSLVALGAVYCGRSRRDRHGTYSLVDYGYVAIGWREGGLVC
jgi:hypothetical protein